MDKITSRFKGGWQQPESAQAGHFAVYDPATQEVIARVEETALDSFAQVVVNAQTGLAALRQKTATQRALILRTWYELIVENRDVLAELVTRESGKPLSESLAEVDYAAGFVIWYGEEAKRAYGQIIPATAINQKVSTIKQPVGVVFGITPWNFPLAMITRKVAPAYAAGCSFILKPSETTPLSAIALHHLALEAGFEAQDWQLVHTQEPKALASYFCGSAAVQKITFTGSTQVGRSLMEQGASTIKRMSLELGGNAPFIVFASADVDAAVEGLIAAKYRNAGQTCIAANRVFVESACYEEFLTKLTAKVATLKQGNGLQSGIALGPLINTKAKERVTSVVNEALIAGATLHYQAKDLGGNFYPATILTEVKAEMAVANQELFGPIIAIQRFTTEDEAIALANNVPEGLASYFYSSHAGQIERVGNALQFGMVGINTGAISNPAAPFGGMKQSGLGREGAQIGLDEYLEVKYLCQTF
ncbi:NAD-dependent succinate-semialdehyde dehydrogenase [Pseudoalteromonas xiamenensis]